MRFKTTSSPEWKYRFECVLGCDYRHSKKMKMYLNVFTGILKCWICQGIDTVHNHPEFIRFVNKGHSFYYEKGLPEIKEQVVRENTLYWDYLLIRGVKDPSLFRTIDEYPGYVFIPQSGGWVGRKIYEEGARYIIIGRRGIVNLERPGDEVFVCEGVFGAVKVYERGFHAVSTMGKIITKSQIDEIRRINKKVILCPDKDAIYEWMKYIGEFRETSLYIPHPYKDVSEEED